MKTVFVKNGFLSFVAITALAALSLTACKKDDSTGMISVYMTSGDATGAQMKPVVTTNGSGTLSGTYTTSTHKWDYLISWGGLSDIATSVQLFGPAAAGETGSLMYDLGIVSGGMIGSSNGTVTLTDVQATALINGKCYYVVADPTHPGGEIRGQISAIAR